MFGEIVLCLEDRRPVKLLDKDAVVKIILCAVGKGQILGGKKPVVID